MKLFDSHCHLDDHAYDRDIDAVVTRARDAGVKAAMIVGIGKKSSIKAVLLTETYPDLYASVGIHPHDAKDCSQTLLGDLRGFAGNSKVKAWGETGLDFNRMYSPRKDQERCFIQQLQIADELKLPLIIHERDSGGRLLEILNAHPAIDRKGVIHCFSGSDSELRQYLDLGFHIGITGILTLRERGTELRKQVGFIPEDRLLVETDAPYLTPAPEKNQTRRNEPAFVRSVLLKLAVVRKKDLGQLAAAVWENTCRLYGIDPS